MLTLLVSAQVILVTSTAPKGSTYLNLGDESQKLQFVAAGGSQTVSVSTNQTFTLTTSESWCEAVLTDGVISVKVDANSGNAAREAVVYISARDNHSRQLHVSQLGQASAILVDSKNIQLNDNTTDFSVSVTSNTDVTVETPDWITPAATEIQGSGVLTFKATKLAEAGTSRSGEIVIKEKNGDASVTVVVNQSFQGTPRFIVISDTHFGNNVGEGPMVKVPRALKNLQAKADSFDALFIVGDLTDWGTEAQYKLFKQVFDDRSIVPADLPVYVMMGNHDNYGDPERDHYLTLEQPYHRLIDIKGFPFITTSMNGGYWHDYSKEELAALEENLATAAEKYPGKPIFVFTHVPPENTVYGTKSGEGSWGTYVFNDILKKYPQAVVFTGHTHFPLADPRSIHQGNFTTINDGSVTYSEIEPGCVDEGIHPDKYDYVTEGCIVELDNDWNIEVQRWDTYRDEEILPRWNILSPHDGSKFVYTDARDGGEAPKWVAESSVTVTNVEDEGCTVTFTQATDDEVVHHYIVELVCDGKVVATGKIFSGFYLNSEMPESLTVRMNGIPNDKTMFAQVKAVDSFNKTSDPLKSESFTTKAYEPAPGTEKPVADLFDLRFAADGAVSDVSPRAISVENGGTLSTTYLNDEVNRWAAAFDGSSYNFYKINYLNDADIKNAFANGFSMEVMYKTNNTNDICPLSGQESGGAGIEQATGGQLQFYCRLGGGYKTLNSSVTVETGKWYHVIATYDKQAGKLRMFVNGSPAGELEVSGDFGFPVEAAQWIAVGGDASTGDYAQYRLNGEVCVARMYGKAVSRDEAYLIYQDILKAAQNPDDDVEMPVADLFDLEFAADGAVSDVSARALTVETGSTVPATYLDTETNRWTAVFDANSSKYYKIPYANDATLKDAFSNAFSMEVMYKTNNTDDVCPLSAQESGGAGIEQNTGGELYFYCNINGGYKVLHSGVTVETGKWYHVIATYDKQAGKLRMFINGQPAGEMAVSGDFTFPLSEESQWICVGGDGGKADRAQYSLDGEVCVARMYSKALSRAEALKLFKSVVTE